MASENGQTECARLLIDSRFDKEAADNVRDAVVAVKTDELAVNEFLLQIARHTIACFGYHHIEFTLKFGCVHSGKRRQTSRVGRVFV